MFNCMPGRASDHITDGCEPPCGCWELNSSPPEEQPLPLNASRLSSPLDSFLTSPFPQMKRHGLGILFHTLNDPVWWVFPQPWQATHTIQQPGFLMHTLTTWTPAVPHPLCQVRPLCLTQSVRWKSLWRKSRRTLNYHRSARRCVFMHRAHGCVVAHMPCTLHGFLNVEVSELS